MRLRRTASDWNCDLPYHVAFRNARDQRLIGRRRAFGRFDQRGWPASKHTLRIVLELRQTLGAYSSRCFQ
jgi:hypothetical protein